MSTPIQTRESDHRQQREHQDRSAKTRRQPQSSIPRLTCAHVKLQLDAGTKGYAQFVVTFIAQPQLLATGLLGRGESSVYKKGE